MDVAVHRILCPIDFSEHADEIVDWAIHLAEEHHSEIVLLHAYQLPVEFQQIEGACLPDEFWMEVRGEAERALSNYADRVRRAGVPVAAITREGSPAHVTLDEAERVEADMIVMGSAHQSPLVHFLVGSVPERVMHNAPCPVLTVKTH